MPLLVLAYPKIADKDLAWIESIREVHDELYAKAVAPHFTLVFPVDLPKEQLIQHTRKIAKEYKGYQFALKCAVVVNDAFNDYMHVFLVPDEGYSDCVKLHDRLYSDILVPELKLDIPFIPHIGIGNSLNAQSCKELADQLNKQNFAIQGRIENLDVVLYENNKINTLEQIVLSNK